LIWTQILVFKPDFQVCTIAPFKKDLFLSFLSFLSLSENKVNNKQIKSKQNNIRPLS